jgi:hypothetical protein
MRLIFKRSCRESGNLQSGPAPDSNGNALGKAGRDFQDRALSENLPLAVKQKLMESSVFSRDRALFAEARQILGHEKCGSDLLRLAVHEKFERSRHINTFFFEDTNFSKACAWAGGALGLAAAVYWSVSRNFHFGVSALVAAAGTYAGSAVGAIVGATLCHLGNLAARPLAFIEAAAYAVSASVAYHFNKKKEKGKEAQHVHSEKTKMAFAARARMFWNTNIKAISKVAGAGTAVAAILLFDNIVLGGSDLALEGLKRLSSGNTEFLGLLFGVPATIFIEGFVLYAGYSIGRSLGPRS